MTDQNYVTGSNEYLLFASAEYSVPRKHTLKILCKFKHFPRRYKRKREWLFFSEHSVVASMNRGMFYFNFATINGEIKTYIPYCELV